MTETEINTAIAQACGWTDIMVCPGFACTEVFPRGKFNGTFSPLPNYCRDLNAMQDSLLTLDDIRMFVFRSHLSELMDDEFPERSTARQRAEAFCRTLGIWRDDK